MGVNVPVGDATAHISRRNCGIEHTSRNLGKIGHNEWHIMATTQRAMRYQRVQQSRQSVPQDSTVCAQFRLQASPHCSTGSNQGPRGPEKNCRSTLDTRHSTLDSGIGRNGALTARSRHDREKCYCSREIGAHKQRNTF